MAYGSGWGQQIVGKPEMSGCSVTRLLESVFQMIDVMLNFVATMTQSKLCCDGGDEKKKVRKLFY